MSRTARGVHASCVTAAIAASVPGALAQTCTWTGHGRPALGDFPNIAAYDPTHARTLFLSTAPFSGSQWMLWSWDGAQWTLLQTGGPGPRWGAGGVYDAARNRLVVFGGSSPSNSTVYFTDTWEWDGAQWVQAATSGPSPRSMFATCYDSARHRTVLFGGRHQSGPRGDTWEWDGASWTQVATTGPSPRAFASMSFDSVHARSVLLGGDGAPLDLWEWDGLTWSQRVSSVPDGRTLWTTFDPARARLIVGQQQILNESRRETWELDTLTSQWSQRDPGTAPRAPAAFDTARARVATLDADYDPAGTLIPPYITQQPQPAGAVSHSTVTLSVAAEGASPSYQWRRDWTTPLSDGNGYSGTRTATLTITDAGIRHSSTYSVVVSNACASVESSPAFVIVRPACYVNCDESSVEPFLNVLDFNCFLNYFAAGNIYADCDQSTAPPPLSVLDFNCFLNRFAAGCSAP